MRVACASIRHGVSKPVRQPTAVVHMLGCVMKALRRPTEAADEEVHTIRPSFLPSRCNPLRNVSHPCARARCVALSLCCAAPPLSRLRRAAPPP